MSNINSDTSKSFWNDVYQETVKGATKGALVGGIVAATFHGVLLGFAITEAFNRSLGNDPVYPLLKGDKESSTLQFKSVMISSCMLATGTICGGLAGAVKGVAKNIF